MQSVSYTVSTYLSDNLTALDILRAKILTTSLSPQVEYTLRWEAIVESIYGSLTLAHQLITRTEIQHILSGPKRAKTHTGIAVGAYANASRWIHQHWTGNSQPIHAGDIAVLATIALPQPHRTQSAFEQSQRDIASFCRYMSSHPDHSVISAALAHTYFLQNPIGPLDQGKVARLTSSLLLSQAGYDLRGLSHPESLWAQDTGGYSFALEQAQQLGQLTPWLEYVTNSIKTSYIALLTSIERASESMPTGQDREFSILTKRQQHILDLGANPDYHLTNRGVQTHFHISAITASRDLTKLTTIGLLYAHGKGRSVYYTRV